MKVLWRKANENASIKHKQRKDAKNEAYHEEPTVTHDPIFFKEPIYFNIFKCGKNILNMFDSMCEQVCMATPIDKYYTKMYETLVD